MAQAGPEAAHCPQRAGPGSLPSLVRPPQLGPSSEHRGKGPRWPFSFPGRCFPAQSPDGCRFWCAWVCDGPWATEWASPLICICSEPRYLTWGVGDDGPLKGLPPRRGSLRGLPASLKQ